MKIIGIDPAPTKKSTVYDGNKFVDYDYKELKEYLEELNQSSEGILICWDAPLSFSLDCETPFSKRIIEKFFSRKEGYKTPEGISIMGYSTCPHWMISQYLLGYPKINSIDANSIDPFNLVFKNSNLVGKKSITEVHPALALWLWCKQGTTRKNWTYKKDDKVFNALKDILISKGIVSVEKAKYIDNDDKLDAYIAWKLGELWVTNNDQVIILGDNKTGSLLLPKNENVIRGFNKFKE